MQKNKKLATAFIIIATLGRLIPHPPNLTPLTGLCLFAGMELSRRMAIFVMLLSIVLADIGLAYLYGYPIFSYWTLFTYSGFLAMILLSSRIKSTPTAKHLIIYALTAGLGFWLWTNFGVWLTSVYYPKTVSGLISCYLAALPFLRNALLGDLTWMAVIFGSYRVVSRNLELRGNI